MQKKLSTKEMTLCALFTVLTAAGAFIKIPIPVVPFTLQFLFTMMAGLLLGGKLGAYVTGRMVENKSNLSFGWILLSNFAGLAIVYGAGMIYYYIICNFVINTPIGLWPLFLYCFLLAVPGDICLCFLAAALAKRLRPVIASI